MRAREIIRRSGLKVKRSDGLVRSERAAPRLSRHRRRLPPGAAGGSTTATPGGTCRGCCCFERQQEREGWRPEQDRGGPAESDALGSGMVAHYGKRRRAYGNGRRLVLVDDPE